MDDRSHIVTPTTIIAVLVLIIVAGTIAGVFIRGDSGMMNTVSGLVIGTGLGGVSGYFFGSSRGSQIKDQALVRKSDRSD